MGKATKALLGLATLIPLLYFAILFLTPLGEVFSIDPMSPQAPPWILYFTAFHFFMFLYTGLMLAFYLINLFGRKDMQKERKLLWALALLAGSVLSMPLYWYFNIWKS